MKSDDRKINSMNRSTSIEEDNLEINYCYCVGLTACFGLGTWHRGFAFVGNTSSTPVFEAKFGWDKDETIFYNTVISSAAIVGLAVGSFLTGFILKLGRRKAAIVGHIIAISGSAIAMFCTVPTLTIGRFFIGFAGGVSNVVFGKMIGETIPTRVLSKFAMSQQGHTANCVLFTFALGQMLPNNEDTEALAKDELWRIIYLAPAMVGVIQIVFILTVFRYEPVAYCIMTGRE